MSGEKTFEILEKIFIPKNENIEIKGYTIKYGHIVQNGEIIDEVLVSYFKGPKSYTTEDMCEINSHGGNIIVNKILEICLENGAELAEAGEFTKRAFLNGRIDLSQAESVIDIINAKTEKEVKTGVKQLEGFLSQEIKNIKQEILDSLVNIEVSIDYPEYDIEEIEDNNIEKMLENVENSLEKLEKSFDNGKIIKEGINTAIIGRPNAGKSSLLNAILKEERAIVTEYEGTTRDSIEEFATINGVLLKLIDTAGIRQAVDEVEKIGIDKAKKIAQDAELIIYILDSSKELEKDEIEILENLKNKNLIILLNKIDLEQKIFESNKDLLVFSKDIINISIKDKIGIDKLYEKITEMFNLNKINLDNEIVITNERHKNLIKQANNNVQQAQDALKNNMPIDLISICIKGILEKLNTITGESVSEDVLNEIFSKFCLGK